MAGECNNMFDVHCKEAFSTAKEERKGIKDSLTSLENRILKTNGKTSIVDSIQDNKKALDSHIKADARKPDQCKTIWGGRIKLQPIESRDIPRVIYALTGAIIALEVCGLLQPILEWFRK